MYVWSCRPVGACQRAQSRPTNFYELEAQVKGGSSLEAKPGECQPVSMMTN